MTQAEQHVVIVGAGYGGGSAAALLRQYGWGGYITLLGAEPALPYHRPPLSKAWLKGEVDHSAILLRSAEFYEHNRITLHLEKLATDIDRSSRRVMLESGRSLPYTKLILATGARPRQISLYGAHLNGVLRLRTQDDANRLREFLAPGKRLVIVGGGYIGLETAASARSLGAEVVIIERERRLLARVACPMLSEFFKTQHESHGVTIVLDAEIQALVGSGDRVAGVRLSGGRTIACDAVLVGIGSMPNQDLAERAGLACNDGIIVDHLARTHDPSVFAVGDCTRRPVPIYDGDFRLESVPNALEQAKQAAAAIVGRFPPAPEVPWFWSDQYDIRLQIAGLPVGASQTVLRGNLAQGSFAIFHLASDNRVLAVEAVNAASEFLAGRVLVGTRKRLAPDQLGNSLTPIKSMLKAAEG